MQSIVLATDFSTRSDRALRRAVLLAREDGTRVHLLHVVDDDRPRRIVERDTADAKALLEELALTLENVDGVPCDIRIVQADPFAGIAKTVSDISPDLLVLGPHRRQLLRDVFVGTTAERTIRAVDCPVLMVNGLPAGPYKQTLLTTDLSASAQTALGRFEPLNAGGMHTRMAVVHVFDAPALKRKRFEQRWMTQLRGSQEIRLGGISKKLRVREIFRKFSHMPGKMHWV